MLVGDDGPALADMHRMDDTNLGSVVGFFARHAAPDANPVVRGLRVVDALRQAMRPEFKEGKALAAETAVRIAKEIGLSQGVQDNLAYLGERWDGKGSVRGIRGQFIPVGARIVGFAEVAFLFQETDGVREAQEIAMQRRGKAFDPTVVDAYLALIKDSAFLAALDQESLLETIWDMEPESPYSRVPESRLDDIATAFAEVIDTKSPFTGRHSKGVALVAETLARKRGLSTEEVTLVKRAGLLHDMGKVGVSNSILDKPGKLTDIEAEKMRLHPYYTDQILSRVEAFRPLSSLASAHHEWMNGGGYFRQLKGSDLPHAAHIIAISDMFQALSEERPYRPAMETEQVLGIMEKEVGNHLCADCFASLKAML